MKTLRKAFAKEEHSDGVQRKEVEQELLVRVVDLTELDKAQKTEFHEQWEISVPKSEGNATSLRSRIRKTLTALTESPVYVHTTKTKEENSSWNDEVSIPTTEPHFNQYRAAAESGMIKERFFFPIENQAEGTEPLVWELDMYPIDHTEPFDRKYKQWARLEIENIPEGTALPELPIAVAEVIIISDSNTPEEKEKIDFLFKNEFLSKNKVINDA